MVTVALPRVNREGVPRSPVPKLRVAVRDDAYESVVDIVVEIATRSLLYQASVSAGRVVATGGKAEARCDGELSEASAV